MAHILFGDMSQAGLLTLRAALALGHQVTFVRGLSARHYVADESFHELAGRVTEVVDVAESADVDQLVAAIGDVHARRPVDAVISQCDPMMEALALACERLGLRYTSSRGIGNARDKARARTVLEQAGLTSARFAVVHTRTDAVAAAERIGFPVVVKPVSGLDSILASRADSPAEVATAAGEILATVADEGQPKRMREQYGRGILVEEHLGGELVSAEIGVLDGRSYRFLVCGRSRGRENDCVEVGAVLPANLPEERVAECFDYAERVCRLLGLDFGVFHVELMLTDRGPVLVEVNPRVMGGVMTRLYEILVGTDFCEYVIDLHLGREPKVSVLTSPRTITARRLMPTADGTLPATADVSWLGGADTGIVNFENLGIRPGSAVRRQQVIGRYAVLGDNWTEAMRRANDLIPRFADSIGIPLIEPAMLGAEDSE